MTQPNHVAKLAELNKVDSWKRSDFIENGGWDKMPGQKESSPQVSQACYDKLSSVTKI